VTNSNKTGTVYGISGAKIMKQESVAENKERIESRRSLNAENKGNKVAGNRKLQILCLRRYRNQE
jgi:hypothetical protein